MFSTRGPPPEGSPRPGPVASSLCTQVLHDAAAFGSQPPIMPPGWGLVNKGPPLRALFTIGLYIGYKTEILWITDAVRLPEKTPSKRTDGSDRSDGAIGNVIPREVFFF